MKKYKVKIEGTTPYMQHRMDSIALEEWEKNRKLIIERQDISKTDNFRAEYHSYNDEQGFYIPTEQLKGAMINAGTLVKSKMGNARKSMTNIVASMFFIEEEKLRLPSNYVVDKRSAVNKNVKARVIAIRPKWEKWSAEFTLIVDNDTITDSTIAQILEYSGSYIGIGSYRPTNRGWFGKFKIVSINPII